MNADTIPDDPLARDILKALVDSRAGYNYYDDTRLLLPIIERHTATRIAALEARIAELTRELETRKSLLRGAMGAFNESASDAAAARAERDEAVGLLREDLAGQETDLIDWNDWRKRVRAYLTRLAAAPEKETTPPGPYSGT